ncbi:MAG TPA: energy transducer TonB [Pyrinomonadaceae bacterium]|nr:energy transducer TonB [Pyrinomonadaceae bacterium]
MRRILISLAFLSLLSTAAYAQSGRNKGSGGKPPVPAVPEPTGSPDSTKAAKPSPPKMVDGERIYTSKETDEKAHILRKPPPSFPREARRHITRGYVILRAILAADETVKHIEVITGLPHGLSESAIAAARQIKFKPARKDGKPVSVWVEVEYQFQVF